MGGLNNNVEALGGCGGLPQRTLLRGLFLSSTVVLTVVMFDEHKCGEIEAFRNSEINYDERLFCEACKKHNSLLQVTYRLCTKMHVQCFPTSRHI
jgi:hypothetical protein